MPDWQLQDAKNRFSEVVRRAREAGPQIVTLHGKPAVVILSAETYNRLVEPRKSFIEYLLEAPPWSDDLVDTINNRSRDTGRDIEF